MSSNLPPPAAPNARVLQSPRASATFRNSPRRPAIVVLALLATVLPSAHPSLAATTHTWTGSASTSWNTASNWSPSGVPANGDSAVISFDTGGTRTITYDYPGPAVTLSSVSMDFFTIFGGSFNFSMAANNLTTNSLTVGDGTGASLATAVTFNQTGGTDVAATLTLGNKANATGTYALGGTGSLSGTTMYVGNSGTGFVNQTAGSASIAQVTVGRFAGSTGSYSISGGTFSTGATPSGVLSLGAAGGNGTVNQSGGTVTAGQINIAAQAIDVGGTGVYNLTGGTLTHFAGAGIQEFVGGGNGGSGTFNHTGGSNNVGTGSLNVDGGPNVPTYNLGGTAVVAALVADTVVVGNGQSGKFVQGGISQASLATSLTLGENSAAHGTYTLGDSASLVVTGSSTATAYEYVGASGTGTFTQTGGANTVGTAGFGELHVGNVGFSDGLYSLAGGTLTVNGIENIGDVGIGTFNHTAGSNLANGSLSLGANGGTGTYNLSGANSTLLTGSIFVGGTGTGSFTQTDGTNSQQSNLILGWKAGSHGTYSLSGGTLINNGILGGETIGDLGPGSFTQSGISTNSTPFLYLAFSAGVAGTYNLAGGTLTVSNSAGDGQEFVGYSGPGTFTQTGGTHAVSSTAIGRAGHLYLGYNAGSAGIYNLSDGILLTDQQDVGFNAGGAFTQSGGENDPGALVLGSNAGASGTYSISAGAIPQANSIRVGQSGTGTFNQTGGTIGRGASQPVQNLELGIMPGSTGTYALSGNNAALIVAAEQIGEFGTGTFNQSAGSHTILVQMHVGEEGGTGTYNLSGGALVAAAPAGQIVLGGNNINFFGGHGTFNQTGGAVVSEILVVGTGGGTGAYNLSAGSLTVNPDASAVGGVHIAANTGTGTLAVSGTGVLTTSSIRSDSAAPSSLTLSGGTINAGSVALVAGPPGFAWIAGTLNITSDVTWDPQAGFTTTGEIFGPSLALGLNQTLMVTGNETLGGLGGFALTLGFGSAHYVSGTLTLPPQGTLTQNFGSTLYAATLVQSGGTVNGTLQNQGHFVYQSGTFAARLLNQGTVTFGPSFAPAGGVENDASMTLSAGQTLVTANGAGLTNYGTFVLAGGTVAGNGGVLNDYGGEMQAFGAINTGTINNGRLTLNGTLHYTPASALTNNGVFQGAGTFFGNFANNLGGLLQVDAAKQISFINGFTNVGLVNLSGPGAILAGGSIDNQATIQGAGAITAPVTNDNGIIRASGGELDLTSAVVNTSGAVIQAAPASTVFFTHGLGTNGGRITLQGGAFDNNNFPLTNANAIDGFGTLRASALANASNASIVLAGGDSFVYAPLTNNAGGTVKLLSGTALFYGPTTNNGAFTITGGTALFAGGLSGNAPAAPASLAGALSIDAAGSALANFVRQDTLTSAGALTIRPTSQGGDASALDSLTLTPTATFDLADTALTLAGTPVSTLRSYLFNHELFSSLSNPTHTLGYVDLNSRDSTSHGFLVQLTLLGDANLDGQLNADDYALLDKGFRTGASTWWLGDFNYDGVVDQNDYLLIDATLAIQQGGHLSPDFLSQRESQFGPAYVSALLASVPEPSLLFSILYPLSSLLLTRRRTPGRS